MSSIAELDRIVQNGLYTGDFTAAQCVVAIKGQVIHSAAYGHCDAQIGTVAKNVLKSDSLFDMGFLTAFLVVNTLCAYLVGRQKLTLSITLGAVCSELKPFPIGGLTLGQLLVRDRGICVDNSGGAYQTKEKIKMRMGAQAEVAQDKAWVLRQACTWKITDKQSDVPWHALLLGYALETIVGMDLKLFFQKTILQPLALEKKIHFCPDRAVHRYCVSGGYCSIRKRWLKGEVHDIWAWHMGGVSGHAGLFASAESIYPILQLYLDTCLGASHINVLHGPTLSRFWKMAPTSKLFITMGGYFMSAGYAHILGSRWSKNSIGGFVQDLGSFWVDWHKRMIGIFLTNARYCANEDGLEKKSNTKKGYVYYSARLFDQMAAVAEGLGQDIDEK